MKGITISHLRLAIQVTAVVIINLGLFGVPVIAAVLLPSGLPMPTLACHYFEGGIANCFIYQLQHYLIAGWEAYIFLALAIFLFAIMSVSLGRLFCGWVCPIGFIQDLLISLRKFIHIRHLRLPSRINNLLGEIRYLIVAGVVIISTLIAMPFILPVTRRVFDLPYCQVCPAKALFLSLQGVLGIIRFPVIQPFGFGVEMAISMVSLLSLAIFVTGTFTVRRFWCRFCPMGGLIALTRKVSAFSISKDVQKCTRCGICARVCPVQETKIYEEREEKRGGDVNTSRCILCTRCVEMCPEDDCLKLNCMDKPIYESKAWIDKYHAP